MERDLRRFPHRADEQQDAGEGQRVDLPAEKFGLAADKARGPAEHRPEIKGAEDQKHRKDAEGETEIADAIDDERLDRGGIGGGPVAPEADQQVRHQADAFPAEEQLDEIVGGDQRQHGESEQAQIRHEARDRRILGHVADRIDVHHCRDDGHDEDHDAAQRIEPDRPADIDAAGHDPARQRDDARPVGGEDVAKHQYAERHRQEQRAASHQLGAAVADRAAEEAGDDGAEQRQEHDGDRHRLNPSSY